MAYELGALGELLRTQLYRILVMSKEGKLADDVFVTWCSPGLPFTEKDFQFASKALTSSDLLLQAQNFAVLTDFIPRVAKPYDIKQQSGLWQQGAERMSALYGELLDYSEVAEIELTDEQQKRYEKAMNYLYKEIEDDDEDEAGGKSKKKTGEPAKPKEKLYAPSTRLKAYRKYRDAYEKEVKARNAAKIAAEAAKEGTEQGAKAVREWSDGNWNERVEEAYQEWASAGFKHKVEEEQGVIDQMTRRSLVLWKRRALAAYRDGQKNGEGKFHYTTVAPARFASSDGWTEYEMYHQMLDKKENTVDESWQAGGALEFGLFSFGGGTEHASSAVTHKTKVENFGMRFSMTQVQIVRPWLYPEFLTSRSWRTTKDWRRAAPSTGRNGTKPPEGSLVGYPIQALVVKDLEIESQELADALSKEKAAHKSDGSGTRLGFFSLGGKHQRAAESKNVRVEIDGAKISVKGMQIIGFVNRLLGPTPDLDPELKDKKFV